MSAQQVIEEFKALPSAERAQVAKFVVEHDDSWIPDEFKEAMKDAEACEQTELEMVLEERSKGPFSPLETDWKERVRKAAKSRG